MLGGKNHVSFVKVESTALLGLCPVHVASGLSYIPVSQPEVRMSTQPSRTIKVGKSEF